MPTVSLSTSRWIRPSISLLLPTTVSKPSKTWHGSNSCRRNEKTITESLPSPAPRPQLLDKRIRHSGDVVCHCARQPFIGNLRLVVGGQQAGIGHQKAEQFLDNLLRVRV